MGGDGDRDVLIALEGDEGFFGVELGRGAEFVHGGELFVGLEDVFHDGVIIITAVGAAVGEAIDHGHGVEGGHEDEIFGCGDVF